MNWRLALYNLSWRLAMPLALLYLLWRSRRQPTYRHHWAERLGFWPASSASLPGADSAGSGPQVLWIHAVSLGETRAVAPLVLALARAYPQAQVLVTQMTPTGREMAESSLRPVLGARLRLSYLPYDTRVAMRRFLQHFRPSIGILMETELWPSLIDVCHQAGMPLVLVSARLSERSMTKALRRYPVLAREVLGRLAGVAAQTPEDASRLRRLGAPDPVVLGNLKFDVTPPPERQAMGRSWRHGWPHRQVVLTASTREGEEALLAQVVPAPGRLWVLVPRHPQRFDEVARWLRSQGHQVARHARQEPVTDQTTVLLGDTLGELPAWYAACDVAIIGGSFLPLGGQNLIEACACGAPVVVGPHTFNFAQATEDAIAAGAACRVGSMAELASTLEQLMADPERLRAMGDHGRAFTERHAGATARYVAWLRPWLGEGPGPGPGR